jgi:hypothetical protein
MSVSLSLEGDNTTCKISLRSYIHDDTDRKSQQ